MHIRFFMFLVLMTSNTILSQEFNASAKYNYTMFYNQNSESIYRQKAAADLSTGSWKYGIDLESYTIDYQMSAPFNSDAMDKVFSLQGLISYKKAIGQKWDVGLSFAPRLIWMTSQNAGLNNIIPEGSFSLTRKYGSQNLSSFSIGVSYSTVFGKPAILPLLSYQTSIRKFSIRAGIPETVLSYNLTPEHSFSAWGRASSFYASSNGNNYFSLNGTEQRVTALEWVDISAGLGYKYKSHTGWDTTLSVGKTVYNKLELSGYGDNDLDTGIGKSLSVSLNFIYKLNFKK
ncbi:hypothetical protein AAEO56_01020 [Flavobacterium sp. DGU11]|uniref:DUF6268 domain-containing protein n=1 Tax=Flavobacterium arundinis TaxID=3139143 RepID=A0ABU9HRP0_9FLAO